MGISESRRACVRACVHFNPAYQPVSALVKLDGQLGAGGAVTVWAQNTHLECKHSATLTRNDGDGEAKDTHTDGQTGLADGCAGGTGPETAGQTRRSARWERTAGDGG